MSCFLHNPIAVMDFFSGCDSSAFRELLADNVVLALNDNQKVRGADKVMQFLKNEVRGKYSATDSSLILNNRIFSVVSEHTPCKVTLIRELAIVTFTY